MNEAQKKEASRQYEAICTKILEAPEASGISMITYGGSIAYGLATDSSDIDLRGAYMPSAKSIILGREREQFEMHDDADTVIYSYKKLVELMRACNPNIIEILGIDNDDILFESESFKLLRENKNAFMSQRCGNTFGGYATQQLRRIQNSISRDGNSTMDASGAKRSIDAAIKSFDERYKDFGATNSTLNIDLDDPTGGAQGLKLNATFNGITLSEARGILSEINDIAKNADNLSARNRKKDTAHLSKHMSHLIRLLRMGSEMLETGEIHTKRTSDRNLLLAIKKGKWISEDNNGCRTIDSAFWDLLDQEEKRFKYAKQNTSLPDKPNNALIDEILLETYSNIIAKYLN